MPPKKKQPPRNAFYYFMVDFKNRQGQKFKSMAEVSVAAGPHWARMSPEQRKPFEEMAKREKQQTGRLTCDGIEIEKVEQEEIAENMKKEEMKTNISQMLYMAKKDGRLETEMFYIVYMNSFCICESTGVYYPAEVSIVGFNLQDGVHEDHIYHSEVKPGQLPMGYKSIAKLHSEETHRLEVPMSGDEDDNTLMVFEEILEFLETRLGGSRRLPILYAEERNMPMVVQVFETLCSRFGQKTNSIQIYNLQYLFRILRNVVAGKTIWPSDTYAYTEIEKDIFAYTSDIACQYHQMIDVVHYCSKSYATRYAYIICDHCCADLNICLLPGCHVPSTAKVMKPVPKKPMSVSLKSRGSDSIREDSDTNSVISLGKSKDWETESVDSSIGFGDLDNFPTLSSKNSEISESADGWDGFTPQDTSSQISYAGAMGSSGFSRRPRALPHILVHGMNSITINPPPMDGLNFPPVGRGRARALNTTNVTPGAGRGFAWGKGRGDLFKKTPSQQ